MTCHISELKSSSSPPRLSGRQFYNLSKNRRVCRKHGSFSLGDHIHKTPHIHTLTYTYTHTHTECERERHTCSQTHTHPSETLILTLTLRIKPRSLICAAAVDSTLMRSRTFPRHFSAQEKFLSTAAKKRCHSLLSQCTQQIPRHLNPTLTTLSS